MTWENRAEWLKNLMATDAFLPNGGLPMVMASEVDSLCSRKSPWRMPSALGSMSNPSLLGGRRL